MIGIWTRKLKLKILANVYFVTHVHKVHERVCLAMEGAVSKLPNIGKCEGYVRLRCAYTRRSRFLECSHLSGYALFPADL
jgi:hypothetical protein